MKFFSRKKQEKKKPNIKVYGSKELSPTTDEILSELQPSTGLEKYRNMEDNEPIIGGLLLRLTNVLKSADWDVLGTNASLVKRQLEALPYGIVGLIEDFASAFTFGFSLNEKIWASDGGQIYIADLEPRYQLTIQEFISKAGENYTNQIYARQWTNEKGSVDIPLAKCIHFIPRTRCRNPYGRSLLRSVYKPYYYKASIEASEAQGIDRSLSGLPTMTAPEGFDFVNADEEQPGYDEDVAATLEWAENVVSKVRKDEIQGVVKPYGWVLELLKGENSATVNTPEIIGRFNVEMAIGLLQSFAIAGGFASTNNSNIEEMIDDFRDTCNSFLGMMENTINRQLISEICQFNLKASVPKFKFGSVSKERLDRLASFVGRLVVNGVMEPTDTLEEAMYKKISVPYSTNDRKPRIKK